LKAEEEIKKELFGTIHEEVVKIVETPVDIRIVCKNNIVVLDKIRGTFAIVKKELLMSG